MSNLPCYTLQHRLLQCVCARDAHVTYSKEQRGCCAFVSSHIISITCQSCSTSKAEAGREKVKWTEPNRTKQVVVKTANQNSFLHSSLPHSLALSALFGIVCLFMDIKCTRCCMYVLWNCDLCHLYGGVRGWYISRYNGKRYVNHFEHRCFEFLLHGWYKILTINCVSMYCTNLYRFPLWH